MEMVNPLVVLGVLLALILLPERVTSQCPVGWRNYRNKTCYLLSRQRTTWYQARKICARYGSDLVKIKSQQENDFLTGPRRGSSWIGLFRDPRDSTRNRFVWTDRSPLTQMANWGWGEPSSRAGRSACVEMHSWEGTWHEYPCRAKFRFICQKAANKCVINNGGCDKKCTYSEGESMCSCADGFASFNNGRTCVALQEILTAGRVWEKKCLRSSSEESCQCAPGYIKTQTSGTWSCVDVDECQQNNGGCQHTCVNTAGSYKCTCNDGFVVSQSGKTCIDVITRGEMGVERCSYVEGSCVCRRGYEEKALCPTYSICVKSRAFESTPPPTETTKTMDWNRNTTVATTESLTTESLATETARTALLAPETGTIKASQAVTEAVTTDSPTTDLEKARTALLAPQTGKVNASQVVTEAVTTDTLPTETAGTAQSTPKTGTINASQFVPEAAEKPSATLYTEQPSTASVRKESQRQSVGARVSCSGTSSEEQLLYLRVILVLLVALFCLALLSFLYLVFSFSRLWRAWNQGYELTNNDPETSEFMMGNPSKKVADSITNPLYEEFVKNTSSSVEQGN